LPEATERLQAIGRWMKVNGESIYETTASPFGDLEWGRCTKKEYARGSTLYLHVFDWPSDGQLFVPGLKNKVEQAYLMDGWNAVETSPTEEGVMISLPPQAPDEIASVVVLQVHGALDVEEVLPAPDAAGTLVLLADMAYIHNNEGSEQATLRGGRHSDLPYIGRWTDEEAWVEWSFKIDQPGQYEMLGEFAVEGDKSRFRIGLPNLLQSVTVRSTDSDKNYVEKSLCIIKVDRAGEYTVQMKPEPGKWSPVNVRKITLRRK
jgi:alpha-L-fucosidase